MVGGGIVCGDWGLLALVIDFREVLLTSHPELAHCGGRGGGPCPRGTKSTIPRATGRQKKTLEENFMAVGTTDIHIHSQTNIPTY